MVASVPLVGQADVGAQRAPSEVTELPVMAAIPLPTAGWIGLLTPLVMLTVAGTTQPVMTPPTQVEVAADMTNGS